MSLWDRIIESVSSSDRKNALRRESSRDASRYAFVDVEVGVKDKKIHDIGALRWDGTPFHSADKRALVTFLADVDFICGHNIIHHDARFLFGEEALRWVLVDTLYVSPLLFPERPYHHLLKDDKLVNEQMNNPVNDSEKARDLLMTDPDALLLSLNATGEEAAKAAARIGEVLERRLGLGDRRTMWASLATEELLTVIHDINPNQKVRAELTLDFPEEDTVRLIIRDDGEIFDFSTAASDVNSLSAFVLVRLTRGCERNGMATTGSNRSVLIFKNDNPQQEKPAQ